MSSNTNLSAAVPAELFLSLSESASRNERSLSGEVRIALRRYLADLAKTGDDDETES
jgi:hypothetical protein